MTAKRIHWHFHLAPTYLCSLKKQRLCPPGNIGAQTEAKSCKTFSSSCLSSLKWWLKTETFQKQPQVHLWLCAIVKIIKGTHAAARTAGIQPSHEIVSVTQEHCLPKSAPQGSHLVTHWSCHEKSRSKSLWEQVSCFLHYVTPTHRPPPQAPRMRREHGTCHLFHINKTATWAGHSAVCEDAQKSNSAPPIKKLIRYTKT